MSPQLPYTHLTFRTIFLYGLTLLGILIVVGYILFQARFILEGPQIALHEGYESLQTARTITLEGTAQNIVRITLNGRQIYTDASGNFKEVLVLENGYTVATLRAEDRYGRSTDLQKAFVYKQEDHSLTN
jgi:hypothetical protein